MVHTIKKTAKKSGKGIHKTKALVKTIKDRGYITEKEIMLLKRKLNSGNIKQDDIEEIFGMKITPEQTKKGFDWLMNKWKTPRGVERKNNPFGFREQKALETFDHFVFDEFFNNINYYQAEMGFNNYLPVYTVVGKESNFQYYVAGGEPHIIG